MTEQEPAAVHEWLSEKMPADVRLAIDRLRSTDDVVHVAVMPDVHRAENVCVGVAVATRDLIYPAAVGGDIGCGMLAVAFDADCDVLREENRARALLALLKRAVPCHKHEQADAIPEELLDNSLSDPRLDRERQRDGRVQFGTLGRGNHFVELQADENERLWLMLHSGSRAMGQVITAHHLWNAEPTRRGLLALNSESEAGMAYLHDVAWAVRYAEENRMAMARAVAKAMHHLFGINIDWSTLIHENHNHVRREEHYGQSWLIHRKGALHADAEKPGVIPGSMGTCSFHVIGRGHPESLMSSSHGAGRKLPRTAARVRISTRDLERQLGSVWYDNRLSQALCEEAPAAYKDIRKVMRAQRELTKIIRELRPLLVYKGR